MTTLMGRITAEDNLRAAWRAVRANRGGPGTDAVRLADFEADLAENLSGLRARLRDGSYLPLPLRRATLTKKGGGERALAIPAVADRVAQRAFVQVLEGVFEPVFLPCSFGYRPGRGVAEAVEAVLRHRADGHPWILDADVRDFFPSVDHALLMERLRRHVRDRAVLHTVGLWLEAGALADPGGPAPSLLSRAAGRVREAAQALVAEEDDWDMAPGGAAALLRRFGAEAARLAWDNRRALLPLLASRGLLAGGGVGVAMLGAAAVGEHLLRARPSARGVGTPQGGPISPLLSNVYLHAFDERMTAAGLRLVRYADDFVVCCASEARARQARAVAAAELERLRLALHPEKTRIVACADPLRFLGYEFDRDGAFPAPEEPAAAVARGAARRGAQAAGEVARHGAQAAGRAAKVGTDAARRAGASVAGDLAGRWREVRDGKRDGRG